MPLAGDTLQHRAASRRARLAVSQARAAVASLGLREHQAETRDRPLDSESVSAVHGDLVGLRLRSSNYLGIPKSDTPALSALVSRKRASAIARHGDAERAGEVPFSPLAIASSPAVSS